MTNGRLPIDDIRDELESAVRERPVVLTSPTGSGKSTAVPRWLMALGLRVLVIEPRRVACRSLARHVSRLEGCAVGETVGYAVRHDDRSGAGTRLSYVTTGVALRRFQQRGGFAGVDAVVLDEAHERSVEVDLLLGLLKRSDVPVRLVMSATLDEERVAGWLGGALVRGAGRIHPVSVEHQGDNVLPERRDLPERVAAAVRSVQDREGDILVFLPGKAEIAACRSELSRRRDLEVIPLHGALPPREQDRAFDPGPTRRVVLATNVAETSVTLPRIGVVIDSGLVRQTRYRHGYGVLTTVSVAMDAAEQRRGRAGRLMPGHCVRLWHSGARLAPVTPPELLREGLERATLVAASCGQRLAEMDLLDPPPDYAVASACRSLQSWGALDGEGDLTTLGESMGAYPLDPPHARVLVEAQKSGRAVEDVVDLVATLAGDRRLLASDRGREREVAEARLALADGVACDGALRIGALRSGDAQRDALNGGALEEARRTARQLRRQLGLPALPRPGEQAGRGKQRVDREGVALAFLGALPGCAFVPRKRGEAWTCGGAEVTLERDSLAPPDSHALVVAARRRVEARRGRGTATVATVALPCRLSTLRKAGVGEDRLARTEVRRKPQGDTLWCAVERRVAHVAVGERELVPEGTLAVEALATAFAAGRLGRRWKGSAAQARERLERRALLARLEGGPAPALDLEEHVRERAVELGFASGHDLALLEPEDLLPPTLDETQERWLDSKFPRRLDLGDARCRVEYDVARKTVTVVKEEGSRKAPPASSYLPPWAGWRVEYRDRNVVRVVRK